MTKLTYEEEEKMEEIISNSEHKLGSNGDMWYPKKEEIDAYITDYNKPDIKFLIHLLYPGFELTPKQKEVQNYVRNLLADETKVVYEESEEDEDLSDIFEKYKR